MHTSHMLRHVMKLPEGFVTNRTNERLQLRMCQGVQLERTLQPVRFTAHFTREGSQS